MYEHLIDDIIQDTGGIATGGDACPEAHLNIVDHDGYESCDNCFLLNSEKIWNKLTLKELRKKKCEWAVNGTIIYTEGVQLHFVDDEDNDQWIVTMKVWDNKSRSWKSHEDEFEKALSQHYGIEEAEAKKMTDWLWQHNNPENIMGNSSLVFYREG